MSIPHSFWNSCKKGRFSKFLLSQLKLLKLHDELHYAQRLQCMSPINARKISICSPFIEQMLASYQSYHKLDDCIVSVNVGWNHCPWHTSNTSHIKFCPWLLVLRLCRMNHIYKGKQIFHQKKLRMLLLSVIVKFQDTIMNLFSSTCNIIQHISWVKFQKFYTY